MGLTTSLRPRMTAPTRKPLQTGAQWRWPDGEPEVSDNILRLVLFYTRNLAVPARRDVARQKCWPARTCSTRPVASLPHTAVHHRRQRRRT
jgi:CxxC motif-containing protein (DUF1111 family)